MTLMLPVLVYMLVCAHTQAAFTAKVDALLGEDAGADTPASAAAPGGAAHDASEL